MAVANSVPRFIADSVCAVGQVSAANTARDGSGTIVTIVSAGITGTLIELIRVVATGTTTAGVVRLFIHDGSNARLYAELLVTAITPSTSISVFESELIPSKPLSLPTGYSLRASTHNAETFNVFASGGNY
jgi:hypothetical protein